MPHPIEQGGTKSLVDLLKKLGRNVEPSDNKTYDLKVDGKPAEVKTKYKPFEKIDFLSFTDNQYKEIKDKNFIVFLVCNVGHPEKMEFIEINSSELRKIEPKVYSSHEYKRSQLRELKLKKL